MARKQIVGEPLAFAFYSPELHREHPASTYAFSRLRYAPAVGHWFSDAAIVNILWPLAQADTVSHRVEQLYPNATFRGIVTTNNYLMLMPVKGYKVVLPVVGPAIPVDDLEPGPIPRPPAQSKFRKRMRALGLTVIDHTDPLSLPPPPAPR